MQNAFCVGLTLQNQFNGVTTCSVRFVKICPRFHKQSFIFYIIRDELFVTCNNGLLVNTAITDNLLYTDLMGTIQILFKLLFRR